MKAVLPALFGSLLLSACAVVPTNSAATNNLPLPDTIGDLATNYGYIPLDPLAVDQVATADSCRESGAQAPVFAPLFQSLPDLAVRFAVASLDGNGGLTFGPIKSTIAGSSYRAVLDYVNVDQVPVTFLVRKRLDGVDGTWLPYSQTPPSGRKIVAYEAVVKVPDQDTRLATAKAVAPAAAQALIDNSQYDSVTVPIYVGIGLRVSADVRALRGGISLTGLSAIGAEAAANGLSGTLTVQMLGINGKPIGMALPLPNKLDQTTVENAIMAIGSVRTSLYVDDAQTPSSAADQVYRTPRVVGMHSPIGTDPLLANALYGALAESRPVWPRMCVKES